MSKGASSIELEWQQKMQSGSMSRLDENVQQLTCFGTDGAHQVIYHLLLWGRMTTQHSEIGEALVDAMGDRHVG